MTDTYQAKVSWDGRHWLAHVLELPGAHTYAKTVPTLRKRLREVVVLMDDRPDNEVNDTEAFQVNLDYSLVATEVVQARRARDEYDQLAATLAQQATDLTREAIVWARAQGISLRDTAELLDLSHQRINQIEKEIPSPPRSRQARTG